MRMRRDGGGIRGRAVGCGQGADSSRLQELRDTAWEADLGRLDVAILSESVVQEEGMGGWRAWRLRERQQSSPTTGDEIILQRWHQAPQRSRWSLEEFNS